MQPLGKGCWLTFGFRKPWLEWLGWCIYKHSRAIACIANVTSSTEKVSSNANQAVTQWSQLGPAVLSTMNSCTSHSHSRTFCDASIRGMIFLVVAALHRCWPLVPSPIGSPIVSTVCFTAHFLGTVVMLSIVDCSVPGSLLPEGMAMSGKLDGDIGTGGCWFLGGAMLKGHMTGEGAISKWAADWPLLEGAARLRGAVDEGDKAVNKLAAGAPPGVAMIRGLDCDMVAVDCWVEQCSKGTWKVSVHSPSEQQVDSPQASMNIQVAVAWHLQHVNMIKRGEFLCVVIFIMHHPQDWICFARVDQLHLQQVDLVRRSMQR